MDGIDGYVTLGDFFAALDEHASSAIPAFLEQGQTPESELADPTSFLLTDDEFTAGKTTLEEEQIQDLWLVMGRDYQFKPGRPTFRKRQRGEGITRNELAEMLRSEAPRVEEERVPRTLGQIPSEMLPGNEVPGVHIVPSGRIAQAQTKLVPDRGVVGPLVKDVKKLPGWIKAGALGAIVLAAFWLVPAGR